MWEEDSFQPLTIHNLARSMCDDIGHMFDEIEGEGFGAKPPKEAGELGGARSPNRRYVLMHGQFHVQGKTDALGINHNS